MLSETRRRKDSVVAIALNGGRVTASFRNALFAAASREGVSVNEFVLRATGDKLRDLGTFAGGVFGNESPAEPEKLVMRRSAVPAIGKGKR